jgi:acyl-CoA reductase-like NAD-dependent aldehyde dehydrogenase
VQRIRVREGEILALIQEEINCSDLWARINLEGSIGLIEEAAALVTSPEMRGSIPHTESDDSYAFVFNRPLGVVLGIAPWNSPLVLGFRAIIAPLAAGNTVILKVFLIGPVKRFR